MSERLPQRNSLKLKPVETQEQTVFTFNSLKKLGTIKGDQAMKELSEGTIVGVSLLYPGCPNNSALDLGLWQTQSQLQVTVEAYIPGYLFGKRHNIVQFSPTFQALETAEVAVRDLRKEGNLDSTRKTMAVEFTAEDYSRGIRDVCRRFFLA